MIINAIKDFIRENLEKGFDENTLKQGLIAKGWNKNDVEETFNSVKASKTPDSVVPDPGPSSVQYAGFWIRFSASAWDAMIMIPLTLFSYYLIFKGNFLIASVIS